MSSQSNKEDDELPEVLTVQEVADLLGNGDRYVRTLINDGILSAADLGSVYRILKVDVDMIFPNSKSDEELEAERRQVFETLPRVLDAHQVAEFLGVSRKTCYSLFDRGVIPAAKPRHRWHVKLDELVELFRREERDALDESESGHGEDEDWDDCIPLDIPF